MVVVVVMLLHDHLVPMVAVSLGRRVVAMLIRDVLMVVAANADTVGADIDVLRVGNRPGEKEDGGGQGDGSISLYHGFLRDE
ncbi:hypothetical protein [Methylobacterium sp. JK268]